ncbi:hypothetical protein AWC38_SpisGene13628 [Stylophora pistillata]|uniref:Uncharacterized protein n=1 Tax=Stylophora pistillata TaxID=50429 RepID=A0A2B4RTW9_STYPI|nr:hypothetical protein AWC38_SpisGene13628 [Stylophora pistillata]
MASNHLDGATESGVRRSKRRLQLTSRALQNAIEDKRREIFKSRRSLLIIMRSVQEASYDTDIMTTTSDLTAAAEEFGSLLHGLLSLCVQDLHGEFIDRDQLKEENETLNQALLLIDSLKNRIARQSDEFLETRSVNSRHSSHRALDSSTSSSVARLQALADARAASREALYTCLIAEKELKHRTRDAEAERIRQQEKARYEKELKILGADKKAVVANAKIKVFEEALLEQELERDSELPSLEVHGIKTEERSSQWIHSSLTPNPTPTDYVSRPGRAQETLNTLEQSKPLSPLAAPKSQSFGQKLPIKKAQQDTPSNKQPIITSTPLLDVNGSQLIETLTSVYDGLASRPTTKEVIDLVSATQAMLATANLKHHKVVSNSVEAMEAFPAGDRGKGVRDLDLRRDSLPAQRSLGVYCNLEEDTFTFKVSLPEKPFTQRGVLSVVNSI